MHINHVLIQNERSHGEALAISRGSWSVTQTDREVGFAHINSNSSTTLFIILSMLIMYRLYPVTGLESTGLESTAYNIHASFPKKLVKYKS